MSNQHITDFLNYYIKLPNPQYAVLLKGKWGSGKTHFIDEYKKQLDEKQKYIYVSLYGVKNYDEIETKFLQSSNPEIFNEKSIFVGKLADAFINNKIKSSLGIIKKSLSSLNAKGNILIFDDLERCSIDKVDLLGYINNFVEHQSYKVILIANEEELEKTEKYTQIKEKLIGKTFEFISDANLAYDSFLLELKNTNRVKEKILQKYKNIIVKIFEKSETKNLRFLRQGLFDFERFYDSIFDNKHNNDDFLNDFISVFFSSFFEYKSDNKIYDILNIDKIREKYKLKDNYKILDISIWKDVFENSFIDVEKIKNKINESKYFNLDIDNKEIFELANIYDIKSEEEFSLLINNVYTKFNNLKYDKINQIEFVVSIFLFLSENKIYEKDENEIKNIIKQYFDKKNFSNDEIYESNYYSYEHRSYLSYVYFESKKLKEILKYIEVLKLETIKDILKNSLNNYQKEFSEILEIFKMINRFNQYSILNHINIDDFVEYLINLNDLQRFEFKDFFNERYTNLSNMDLEKEVLFLNNLINKLEDEVSNKGKLTEYKFNRVLLEPLRECITKIKKNQFFLES